MDCTEPAAQCIYLAAANQLRRQQWEVLDNGQTNLGQTADEDDEGGCKESG